MLVLFAVLASYVKPVINLFDTWQESKAAEQRLHELQAENERLSSGPSSSTRPPRRCARRASSGMVGPGEQAYMISGLK